MNADQSGERRDDRLVSFPDWNEVLEAEPLAPALKAEYRQEIIAFLHHCKIHHAGASIIVVKQYLSSRPRQEANTARGGRIRHRGHRGGGDHRERAMMEKESIRTEGCYANFTAGA